MRDFLSDCRSPSDVWIADHPNDVGNEPHGHNPIYYSPDIKVCNTPAGCAGSGTNPVFGSPLNYVITTLRNTRPTPAPGPIGGSLYVYYTAAGGNAKWRGTGSPDWTLIGVQHGIFLGAGDVRDVAINWNNVPAPGHYCLLARWVSAGDPMTFEEFYNSDTLTNTRLNNNIAWHNVDVVRALTGTLTDASFDWTPVRGVLDTLVIKPEIHLPGKTVLDLGGLFDGWKRNGGRGAGFEVIGETELLISSDGASVEGIPGPDKGRASVKLSFTIDKAGTWPVHVSQLGGEKGEDMGGVEYRLVGVDPDEPATAPVVAAVANEKGVVLSWTHDVQHTRYTVWRSDRPDFHPKQGELIAEVDAKGADVRSALTFTDPDGAAKTFYYRVRSHGSDKGGTAFSEIATASAGDNAEK